MNAIGGKKKLPKRLEEQLCLLCLYIRFPNTKLQHSLHNMFCRRNKVKVQQACTN